MTESQANRMAFHGTFYSSDVDVVAKILQKWIEPGNLETKIRLSGEEIFFKEPALYFYCSAPDFTWDTTSSRTPSSWPGWRGSGLGRRARRSAANAFMSVSAVAIALVTIARPPADSGP